MKAIFSIKDAVKDKMTLKVTITGMTGYRVRLAIATILIRIAARIVWVKAEIN